MSRSFIKPAAVVAVATTLACVTGVILFGKARPEPVASPATDPSPAPTPYWVKSAGEMRNVMMKGNLDSHFDLAAVKGVKGLYALGPVEGLQGEITVIDGTPSVTTLRDGMPVVAEAWPKACFLVYAQVLRWQTVPIPKGVETLDDLDRFVLEAARKAGLDVDRPFPFLVTGSPQAVKYHVVWKTDGLPHSKEVHQKAKIGFVVNDREVRMLGFFSDKHHGVFTHHETNIHVHFRTTDNRDAGHVDAATLNDTMTLHLPEP